MENYVKINSSEFKDYFTFKDTESLNKAIYSHIEFLHDNDVPQSAINVLWYIGSHSLGVRGVSWCFRATIAEALGVSVRTISRAFTTLKKYGIINKIPTVKGWRRSVDAVQIMPVSFQRVPAMEADKPNNINGSSDKNQNEPISTIKKQENNNNNSSQSILGKISNLSTNIDLDGNLKNIVKYVALKLGEKVKNDGLEIVSFGAYCEKVLSNEIRKYGAKKAMEDRIKAKKAAAASQFESFVFDRYGAKYEELGAFTKAEAVREYEAMTNPKPKGVKLPLYNWLEA